MRVSWTPPTLVVSALRINEWETPRHAARACERRGGAGGESRIMGRRIRERLKTIIGSAVALTCALAIVMIATRAVALPALRSAPPALTPAAPVAAGGTSVAGTIEQATKNA